MEKLRKSISHPLSPSSLQTADLTGKLRSTGLYSIKVILLDTQKYRKGLRMNLKKQSIIIRSIYDVLDIVFETLTKSISFKNGMEIP